MEGGGMAKKFYDVDLHGSITYMPHPQIVWIFARYKWMKN